MNDMIEILLENIPQEKINDVFIELGCVSDKIVMAELQGLDESVDTKDLLSRQVVTKILSGHPLIIKMLNTSFEGVSLPESFIRVYSYNNVFDIELSFDNGVIENNKVTVTKVLCGYFDNIRKKHSVKNIYCGYEPAVDEETRFFTNATLGPLVFK